MGNKILECVPNFSEGRDINVINNIAEAIEKTNGVKLLNVSIGKDTNRSVMTFAGVPDSVAEAAFQAVKKASELIDMSKHHGEHPRMGATDVCPFIPVTNMTMNEAVKYGRSVGERIGKELGIPVFCYENAAFIDERKNLANCRAGEYEGLAKKLSNPEWKPDFGPNVFNIRSGATAVGARNFLVAFNVNINTKSVWHAKDIACDIREKGRALREGDRVTGKKMYDSEGKVVMVKGALKSVKAIGWYIEEYNQAQVSMNLTDISVTPVHIAFEEVCHKAEALGLKVTGSELIGLIPLKAMIEAGKYFAEKENISASLSEKELVEKAVSSLGLNDNHLFIPEKRIIEYALQGNE